MTFRWISLVPPPIMPMMAARRGRAARRRSGRDRHARAGNAAALRVPRHNRWRPAPGAFRSTPRAKPGRRMPARTAANTRQSGLPLSRASAAASSVKPRAVQADQAIGELVLDGLELADKLAELLSYLGVFHGQFERSLARRQAPGRRSQASSPARCRLEFQAGMFNRTSRCAFAKLSSENGGTARPGVTCIFNPGAPLATTATPAGRAGDDQKVCRRLGAFDKRDFSPQRLASQSRAWPADGIAIEGARAPKQSWPCPGVDLRAGRAQVFDCCAASARLAAMAPSSGAGHEARPSSLENQQDFAQARLAGVGAQRGRGPDRPGPAICSRWRRAGRSYRSVPWPAGQRLARNSRTEFRSKPRSASDGRSRLVRLEAFMARD